MRVQHWIATALSVMLALANSREASAQYTEDPFSETGNPTVPVQPAGHTMHGHYDNGLPPAYDQPWVGQDAYGGYPPAYTPVAAYPFEGGDGYGPTMNPWPTISPYDHAFSQHTNDGGLWQQVTQGFGKKWYSSFEYLSTRTKRPDGVLGDTSSQPYFASAYPFDYLIFGAPPNVGDTTVDVEFETDFPDEAAAVIDTNYFNRLDLRNMSDIMGKGGRVTAGFWNPDDSGWSMNFWFTGNSREVFDARKHDATHTQNELSQTIDLIDTPDFLDFPDLGQYGLGITGPAELLSRNLLNLRGLPVNDGTTAGITIPYDLYFQVESRSQNLGAGISHYLTPIFQRKMVRINPSVGVRYLMIDEGFDFVGIDSGWLYSPESEVDEPPMRDLKSHSSPNGFDDDGDGFIDPAGIVEDTAGGEGGDGEFAATFYFPYNNAFALTRAFIDVDTMSHLIGPELGMRYDIGGDKFKLSGETKFGLMVNKEKIELRGDNIGSITRSAYAGGPIRLPADEDEEGGGGDDDDDDDDDDIIETDPALITPTAENPYPNAFADRETHTHFSPLFEQSIFADVNVFGYVPVLKDIYLFENAKFRFGYTFLWANEIVTTNQSVVYDGKPTAGLFPHIKLKRETWWTSNYSFGVSWDF
ncbi:MAG: hypothetical protein AB7O26_16450 [Planctomycetaceae bacterium]